jgi:hypothetical protein
LDLARLRLREFGIAFEVESLAHTRPAQRGDTGVDALVTLSRADTKARYAVAVKEPMTLSSLTSRRSSSPHPLLVVGNRISQRSAAAFREAGVQFVDALGNAFITFGSVFVEVAGRTEPTGQAPKNVPGVPPAPQPTNLFSSGRAKVILALLAWPELTGGTVREISNAAGISVGQTHDAMGRLEQAGFFLPTARRLTRTGELLRYWTAAYPTGLGRRLKIAQYHGDLSRPLISEWPIRLSGESAEGVDIARPATLTVYLDAAPDPKMSILNRWSASPDREPNVFVRHKFWVSPRPEEEDPAVRVRNAPWPLVYADLVATGDPRLGEVARTWRAGFAGSDQI